MNTTTTSASTISSLLEPLAWSGSISRSGSRKAIINRVAQTADLVALAYPGTRGAYSVSDLRSLVGYQLLELVNGPSRTKRGGTPRSRPAT